MVKAGEVYDLPQRTKESALPEPKTITVKSVDGDSVIIEFDTQFTKWKPDGKGGFIVDYKEVKRGQATVDAAVFAELSPK